MVVTILLTAFLICSVFVNAYVCEDQRDLHDREIVSFDRDEDIITITMPIGPYEIKNNGNGQEIFVEDFGRLLVPGKPDIPSKIFAVAIPPGADVVEVSFDAGKGITLPGFYDILPVQLPRAIGQENPFIHEQDLKRYEENFNLVYGCNDPYPKAVGEFVRIAGYRKYNLVDVRITPFTYRPLSGQLIYFPEITVHVDCRYPDVAPVDDVIVDNLVRTERIAEEMMVSIQ